MHPPLKAYVINIPERKDRLEAFKARFRDWNLDLEVVPGVKDAEPWRGCTLSHRAVVQKAKAAGLEWVLILEDDAAPTDASPERFSALLSALWSRRDEWDLFNGGPTHMRREEISLLQKNPPLFSVKGHTSHFILMNASAFDTFLSDITEKGEEIIDLYYRRKFRTVATYPYIAVQTRGYSSIEDKMVDYIPLFKKSEEILKLILESAQSGGRGRRRMRRRRSRSRSRHRTRRRWRAGGRRIV